MSDDAPSRPKHGTVPGFGPPPQALPPLEVQPVVTLPPEGGPPEGGPPEGGEDAKLTVLVWAADKSKLVGGASGSKTQRRVEEVGQ